MQALRRLLDGLYAVCGVIAAFFIFAATEAPPWRAGAVDRPVALLAVGEPTPALRRTSA